MKLREVINSIIGQYVTTQSKRVSRTNQWIRFDILVAVIFLIIPEIECAKYKNNDLLNEIGKILLEEFVQIDMNSGSAVARIAGYWPPDKTEIINDIFLEILDVYSIGWIKKEDQDDFVRLLIRYPFLGKIYQMKKNYDIDYKKAQGDLVAFFEFPESSDRDVNKMIVDMENLMKRYGIADDARMERKAKAVQYCRMGLIAKGEMEYEEQRLSGNTEDK